jgi:cation diffusion facilitator family transporter
MAEQSKTAVVAAALIGTSLAGAQFVIAAIGGSAIMLSEGIHSSIAAANDGLLLIGQKKSRRPADSQHPFGYAQELYIWSMIVAISILGLGGGVSFSEGVRHILKPQPIEKAYLAYLALGIALLFDLITLGIALKQFRDMTKGKSFWNAVNTSKDPNPLIVLGENAAAIVGSVIAMIGVKLNQSGFLIADGIGSVLIGCLLTITSVFLIYQIRHLLIGEAVEKPIAEAIRDLSNQGEKIVQVENPVTLQLGPEDVLLAMQAKFDGNHSGNEILKAIERIQHRVKEQFPSIKHIYIDPITEPHRSGR